MDVSIESPGGLQRQMTVKIPAEKVSQEVKARLKVIAQRAKIPGFRPGKAPAKVIEQQYGLSARGDAITELVQRSYPEALAQQSLNPAGQPQIEITVDSLAEGLHYVARFEVFPAIELQALDQIKVNRPQVEISEADVDRLIENLRKARRELSDVERPAQHGDVVICDFEGKLDGVAFEGGRAEAATIEIGSGQMLPDLENGIVGHAAGEPFIVDVAFPENYRAENLRGRTAQFDVTIKSIKEVVLPVVDTAEFLAAHGADSVEALRERSLKALEREREKAVRARLKAQVLEQVHSLNPIDVPQVMIQQELPRLRGEAAARMNLRGIPDDRLAELMPAAMFEETAKRRAALGLLIGELIRSRGIKLDLGRVDAALADIASDYEEPEEVLAYYRQNAEMMQGLRAMVLEEQVVESLIADISPNDVGMELTELLAGRS